MLDLYDVAQIGPGEAKSLASNASYYTNAMAIFTKWMAFDE